MLKTRCLTERMDVLTFIPKSQMLKDKWGTPMDKTGTKTSHEKNRGKNKTIAHFQ